MQTQQREFQAKELKQEKIIYELELEKNRYSEQKEGLLHEFNEQICNLERENKFLCQQIETIKSQELVSSDNFIAKASQVQESELMKYQNLLQLK